MTEIACSIEEFAALVRPLIGLTLSLPWRGYGSAIFMELGQLTPPPEGKRRHFAKGQASISFWSNWRVEGGSSILLGSLSSNPKIERGIASLEDTRLETVSVSGSLPELIVTLSNGCSLRSMTMSPGDPDWSIRLLDERWIYPRAATLFVGEGEQHSMSEAERGVLASAEAAAGRWGTPRAEPVAGNCRYCAWVVKLDGEGHLLDYGLCASPDSPFDGRVVELTSGCPAYSRELPAVKPD